MYTIKDGVIYQDGVAIQLRGISHYGFNTPILQPQYLWQMAWKQQLAQIKELGFNAVRCPFVPDTLYSTAKVDKLSFLEPGGNKDAIGKTPLQFLDMWMTEADRLGLYVLLDFHSVSAQRQYPTWYCDEPAIMYNKQAYTRENWIRDLVFVAKRYMPLSHFIGIDIYNEPNGVVRWDAGDANMTTAANYWKPAAEAAGAAILAANRNILIFVQGTTGNFDGKEDSSIPMNWGENFQPQNYNPIRILDSKLVLSPHTYGPDVYPKKSFTNAKFPQNLRADWDTLFGQFLNVCPGEWGGRYTQASTDLTWQNAFVDYMLSRGIRNSFYWCYTPNSGDTGGILDDNLKVRTDKMALLKRLWAGIEHIPPSLPQPPVITIKDGSITITGSFTIKYG